MTVALHKKKFKKTFMLARMPCIVPHGLNVKKKKLFFFSSFLEKRLRAYIKMKRLIQLELHIGIVVEHLYLYIKI